MGEVVDNGNVNRIIVNKSYTFDSVVNYYSITLIVITVTVKRHMPSCAMVTVEKDV